MRLKLFCLLLLLNIFVFAKAQETVVLHTSMFDKYWQTTSLSAIDGWIYKQGNDTTWARQEIDTTGWKRFKPIELTMKNADKNGKAEGWFRIKIKPDSSFLNMRINFYVSGWAAEDVYIDGKLAVSSGNTGVNGRPFQASESFVAPYMLDPKVGEIYIIAVHIVDFRSPFDASKLKGENYWDVVTIGTVESLNIGLEYVQQYRTYYTIWASVCTVLSILFWLLYFLNRSEKILPLIAIGMATFAGAMFCDIRINTDYETTFTSYAIYVRVESYLYVASSVILLFILAKLLKRKITILFIGLIILLVICSVFFWALFGFWIPGFILVMTLYLLLSSWKNLKGAQWAVAAGLILNSISFTFYQYSWREYGTFPFPHAYLNLSIDFLSVPLSLMVYVAIRFKEILTEVQRNAKQVVQLSQEKEEQAIKQQRILEQEVARQTIELRTSLENLKSTQAQLIHSEKMASLGELTAGIAHEIQNPLNFVNNFSEVNGELIGELVDEVYKGNYDEVKVIAVTIKDNEEKIKSHGKRADSIVKSMMQHSRTSGGQKEATDINSLCDEYLRLSYHGMRAKEKDFNATIETNFDESIGEINVVPQDIGRVLLNLFNNAFYAVNEKKKSYELSAMSYEPCVSVQTKKLNDKIEIRICDNGNGIPSSIKEKIFQPFFTTKPTGEGTGLGLSLSYDIIKAHGGQIKVESGAGEGSEFIIVLPALA